MDIKQLGFTGDKVKETFIQMPVHDQVDNVELARCEYTQGTFQEGKTYESIAFTYIRAIDDNRVQKMMDSIKANLLSKDEDAERSPEAEEAPAAEEAESPKEEVSEEPPAGVEETTADGTDPAAEGQDDNEQKEDDDNKEKHG